jgi:general secretion pathway protein H
VGPLNAGCGHGRRTRSRAFTLVEVLVVLVVLGIGLALVSVNLGGDPGRQLVREAKQLAGALEHAAALAQWRAETLGVSAEGSEYRFWRRTDDDRWVAFSGDDVLAAHALPAGITVRPVTYAGAPIAADAIVPLRPSGRNEPYVLRLDAGGGHVVIVASDPLNRVGYASEANATGGPAAVN